MRKNRITVLASAIVAGRIASTISVASWAALAWRCADAAAVAFRVSTAGSVGVSTIGDDLGDTYTHSAPFSVGGFIYMIAFTTVSNAASDYEATAVLSDAGNFVVMMGPSQASKT